MYVHRVDVCVLLLRLNFFINKYLHLHNIYMFFFFFFKITRAFWQAHFQCDSHDELNTGYIRARCWLNFFKCEKKIHYIRELTHNFLIICNW